MTITNAAVIERLAHYRYDTRRNPSSAANELANSDSTNKDAKDGIIGQFGVGFYSSFMVSDSVSVESTSAVTSTDPHKWCSDGTGQFTIEAVDSVEGMEGPHGSKIVMKLKESCKEYSDPERIKA